jgi:hypothetical protein
MGQWMPGMIMIADGFNHSLKAKVEALCVELAGSVKADTSMKMPAMQEEQWWPEALGKPSMLGEQNQMRYAYFQNLHRLVVVRHNKLHIYDTDTLHITGVSQQQSNSLSMLTFSSDRGLISEKDLREISE